MKMEVHTVTFTIPYPKHKGFAKEYGLNAIYAGKHWTARQRDNKYWHSVVLAELSRQQIPRKLFTRPVSITFLWDDRMDCSNHAYLGKMIEDALKGYLIQDDSRRFVQEIHHQFHTGKCIQVIVKEKNR
jgi:hypothetical protein